MALIKSYTDQDTKVVFSNVYWIPVAFEIDKMGALLNKLSGARAHGSLTFFGYANKQARNDFAKPIKKVQIRINAAIYNSKVKAVVEKGLTLEQALAKVGYELAAEHLFFQGATND